MSVVNVKVQNIRPNYHSLKNWIEDTNNVYIGRKGVVFIDGERYPKKDSIFANPYKIGKNGTREQVIEQYREYMENNIQKNRAYYLDELSKLKGKNLGCWCHPELCHGDVLLDLIKKYSKRD